MYLDYWNLREAPFQNVADARFAYLCEQHHEGLARQLATMMRIREQVGPIDEAADLLTYLKEANSLNEHLEESRVTVDETE